MVEFRIARSLRRHHGVDDIGVVVADMAIIANEVLGVGVRRRQGVGLHRHAGDKRGYVIGRAAEHAEGGIGDLPMSRHAPLQIVARARTQEIDGVTTAILLVGQRVAVRRVRLHVVDGGDRRGRVAEGRMARDVVDLLAADIDHAAVTQRLQMLLARSQHRRLLMVAGTLTCRIAQHSAQRSRPTHANDVSAGGAAVPKPDLRCFRHLQVPSRGVATAKRAQRPGAGPWN